MNIYREKLPASRQVTTCGPAAPFEELISILGRLLKANAWWAHPPAVACSLRMRLISSLLLSIVGLII